MPTTKLEASDFSGGSILIVDLLVKSGLAPSKSEAKRLIKDGGITVADKKAASFDEALGREAFDGGLIIKKGKKTYHRFVAE